MRKNFLYLGILLLISGIALGLFTPGFSFSPQAQNRISEGVVVNASALGYVPLPLNQSGVIVLTFNSSSNIDFYFANATAFGKISAAKVAGSGSRSIAVSFEGKGVYEVYQNNLNGAFPYPGNQGVASPLYLLNSTLLRPGIYYAIFANPGNRTAQIAVTAFPIPLSGIQSSATSLSTYFGVAFLLFVAGIGLMVFSLLSKRGQKDQEAMDREVEKEYDRIEGRGGKHGKG